jgi:hypothetical protein
MRILFLPLRTAGAGGLHRQPDEEAISPFLEHDRKGLLADLLFGERDVVQKIRAVPGTDSTVFSFSGLPLKGGGADGYRRHSA